jgi:sec-independent protein translocase protein TatC
MVPVLFCAGVVFGYFVVLPAATKFLLNFNQSQFNIQIRAKDYYSFFTMTVGMMGLIFQLPIGILAVTRLGIVTPKQLAQNRRYAYLICAIVAMLLPGTDPVSMLIEMVPLVLLFELSLVLARIFGPAKEPEGGVGAAPGEAPG